ncbi:nucleotidyltransferase domain-containing protein [Saprospiraceae bacterium]|nr:nucleotidyltransferase domain-containing protein [Saprospiraceae bacterium]
MNIEDLRASGWIIYETITGSTAYGTNVEGSDEDRKGIYIQPTVDTFSNYIPQISDAKNDTTFYEIVRFLELLAKGNPNVMEMLDTPEDCVVYRSAKLRQFFPLEVRERFTTTKLKHTFTGFAYSQIQKSKGLNKKVNWDEKKMVRKTPLDFSFVIGSDGQNESSRVFVNWSNEVGIKHTEIGLSKVNNTPTLYSMYHLGKDRGGIINEFRESNQLQLRDIPKDKIGTFLAYVSYDQNAYTMHCKDYKSYQDWLKNRNELRYQHIKDHGQKYDGKNLLHTMRLLNMAKDIADGRGIVVRRSKEECAYLISIRRGEVDLDEIYEQADQIIEEINSAFDKSKLPKEVPRSLVAKLITRIRVEN